jgi:phenylacetaldehyde dehydrogenase
MTPAPHGSSTTAAPPSALSPLARGMVDRDVVCGWVDGAPLPAAGRAREPLSDPSTGDALVEAAEASSADVDAAVGAARRALGGEWGRLAPLERGRRIGALADLVERNAEALVELECMNAGKPRAEAESFDVPQAIEHFRYFAGWPGKLTGDVIDVPQDALVYTRREPIGVVACIVPWNFPLLLAAWKVAPALAAGCTAVVKPAAETPLTTVVLAELASEAGIPPGVLNVLPGGASVGAGLSRHPGVDKIAFTGSTAVGREIVHASADTVKRVSLELGGKSPIVVLGDVDVEAAAPSIVAGAFFHAGQVCVAGTRLYVQSSRFDDVLAAVEERARGLRVGIGLDPATEMGPLVSARQAERLDGYLEGVRDDGGEILVGGGRPADVPPDGFFRQPAIAVGLGDDARASREEVFGPLIVAHRFDALDEVAERANDSIYGLAAGIFTSDLAAAHRLARLLRAGTVWINCFQVSDSAVPTGGMKQSGYGRDRGRQAVEGFLEDKVVWTSLDAGGGAG